MKKIFKLLALILLPLSLTACGNNNVDPLSYVSKVELNTEMVALDPDGTFTLTPKALNLEDNELENKQFMYFASNPTVANVNPAGVITALKAGVSTITVVCETANAICVVKVAGSGDDELISLSFNPSSVKIKLGTSYEPNLVPFPSTVTGLTYKYFSDHEDIAEVVDGKVVAKAKGTCTIKAVYGEITADLNVEVVEEGGDVFTITLDKYTASILVGNTVQLNAITSSPATVTWTSEDDGIATVDNNGLVTGVQKGSVHIKASANGVDSSACVVTVSDGSEGEELNVTFYVDYNNIDTPYRELKWNCGRPFGLDNKPENPKTIPDPAFPVFVGWSSHTIIDNLEDLWDFENDIVPDGMYNFTLYGIWMDK